MSRLTDTIMTMKSKRLTDFEWRVLKSVMDIPMGETRSYNWIARKVGRPNAARAVGQALRKNPYPLIIPCHRVIREDGTLGGYAGKNIRAKDHILKLEKEIKKYLKN